MNIGVSSGLNLINTYSDDSDDDRNVSHSITFKTESSPGNTKLQDIKCKTQRNGNRLVLLS